LKSKYPDIESSIVTESFTLEIYAQETKDAQDTQQELAKVEFEKLHTNQLLEQAHSNINGIRALLKVSRQVSNVAKLIIY
jgi:hypothetical protein